MTRRRHGRTTPILLSAAIGCLLLGLLISAFSVRAQEQAAAPPPPTGGSQPIAFSHKVHADTNAIACQLCHSYARRGPVAGIPSVQRCAQCHQTIAPQVPEVQKLMGYWRAKKPIPWVRVYDLPDYVRFTHKRHVLGGVACENCHGDVAKMDAVVRSAPLTMGWCLNCHEQRHGPTDCLACHY
jgi:hypothetical protein